MAAPKPKPDPQPLEPRHEGGVIQPDAEAPAGSGMLHEGDGDRAPISPDDERPGSMIGEG